MKIFEANITHQVSDFLRNKLNRTTTLVTANQKMFDACGIKHFFESEIELEALKEIICSHSSLIAEPDRAEYGDFQTNPNLASNVVKFLKQVSSNPEIIVEPTCGKGNFIVACLSTFKRIEKIFGVEIYKPYVWETKFNILQFFIDNPDTRKPEIEINHFNVFDFDFGRICKEHSRREILVIGNPPWVTNSKLSSLGSGNLPIKSNFKNHSGLDAMTGKGNFDIGEYITLMMFDAFQYSHGHFAFLVKNSVIKNVVFDQQQRNYNIADLQKLSIDSKKEFNVSVEASLLFCKLNGIPEFVCNEYNFYNHATLLNQFGWVQDKFVSSVELYKHSNDIDGRSPFEWRQGIKHDCSSIMELERVNGHFVNGLQQEVIIEEDLVFGVLKSSDLKETVIDKTRKFTIITQKKVGQDTSFIKKDFPKTFHYLHKNKAQFDLRKSSIYDNKPDYSIFGIGDYSFAPYKISISGLYKNYSFNLVLPQNGKPIMLDDTCYLLGFDKLEFAVYTLILLNSGKSKELLQAITFSDAKRTFTKDILMRIDILKLALQFTNVKIQAELDEINKQFKQNIKLDKWDEFIKTMMPVHSQQLILLEPEVKYKKRRMQHVRTA
ncbi:MAG: hypothetical protein HY960_02755 [Ignavibacteriae bacterium]|nr:hypothetical protein [Ignavibacteriota bacterium]